LLLSFRLAAAAAAAAVLSVFFLVSLVEKTFCPLAVAN
jgi:hypothetical protein